MTFTVRTLNDGVTRFVYCDTCRDSEQSRLELVIRRWKLAHDCPKRTDDPGGAAA